MDTSQLRAMALASDAANTTFRGDDVVVDYVDGKFVVEVHPLEGDRCRLVLGARHHRATGKHIFPATRSQAAGLSGVFGGRLAPTPAAKDHVTKLFERTDVPNQDINQGLFGFQQLGVYRLLRSGSSLLGDEMGTGKTIQAIEWMRLTGDHRFNLVVCPNSMKYKWAEEIGKWWPSAEAIVIDGSAAKRRKQIEEGLRADLYVVYVINYESLRAHTRLAPWGGKALTAKQKEEKDLNGFRWNTVVVDEAHKIKDPGSQQSMAVKQMGLQADYRLAMTGTPLLQDPDDIWSIMNFVSPEEYGSRGQFRARYCRMADSWHGHGQENQGLKPDTLAEFDQFFQPRFLRRTKKEVLPELPDKFDIEYRLIPMDTKQAKVYNGLVDDMMAMVGDELLIAENSLALLTRLRQAACGMLVVEGDTVVAIDKPSNKLEAVKDILAAAPGEPLVVYAESRKFIEMLHENLYLDHRIGMITGAQSAAQRDKAVAKFQDGKLDIILGTLGAGAEGLTLTRASTIVLAQQSWSHGVNAQAIDRVHRIGQTRGVQPIVLVSKDTVDESTAQVDVDKQVKLQQLVRDPEWVKGLHT